MGGGWGMRNALVFKGDIWPCFPQVSIENSLVGYLV